MNRSFRADLHCHSTYSDGTLSVEELILLAKESGLSALSITDHDTMDAYPKALEIGKKHGIKILPGVELSTNFKETSVHVLGYGCDWTHLAFKALCDKHVKRRHERNAQILEKLASHGMPIQEREILCHEGTIGRPHIAQAMMEKGYVKSVDQAFKKFISSGKPCFDRGEPISVEETLETIHTCGGVAVIAHPHLIPKRSIVKALLKMPFDGIECYYGNFSKETADRWIQIAKEREWLITGGSDFHGSVKPHISLGASWIDQDHFEKLCTR